jgi:hypothetical protein
MSATTSGTEHIFGFGKKVTTEFSGTLLDSGGRIGPYNANENDYFVIRRGDFSFHDHIFFTINSWNVADAGAYSTSYDFIDVYQTDGGTRNPAHWQWVERIGGSDLNSGAGLEHGDIPAKFYLQADWIKFVFRSSFRQDYKLTSGFEIQWNTGGSGDTGGFTNLASVGSTTYADEFNLKENVGDIKSIVMDNITEDLAKSNWDFVPMAQFDSEDAQNGIHSLDYEFINFNYIRDPGVKLPLSYIQPERSFARFATETVGRISKEDD